MTGTEDRWSVRKLGVLLYPFTAAAVAINLFMISLVGQAIGWPAMSPALAIALSIPLGIPATWLTSHWVRGLMDEADKKGSDSKP